MSSRTSGFTEADEALLFDIFCRVLIEKLGREEFDRHSFDAISIDRCECSDGLFLRVTTGVGYEASVEWDGSIGDAIKEVVDIATTLSFDL